MERFNSISISPLKGDNELYAELPDGAHAKIYKPTSKPPFIMVGDGTSNRNGDTMDFITILAELPADERFMMKLVYQRSDSGRRIARIDYSSISAADKRKISTAYKKLRSKDYIRRWSRGVFMINPRLILPREDFNSVEKEYLNLKD